MSDYIAIARAADGTGKLYITDDAGLFTTQEGLGTFDNTELNRRAFMLEGLLAGAWATSEYASTEFTITAVGGATNINSITINGVNVLGGVVAATVGDPTQTAIGLATSINGFVSTPDWRAVPIAGATSAKLRIIANTAGSSMNGFTTVVTASTPANITIDPTPQNDTAGGTTPQSIRKKFWINTSASAPEGDTTGATDITDFIATTHNSMARERQTVTAVNSNMIDINRVGRDKSVIIDPGVANATINQINMPGAVRGDRLILRGEDGGSGFTFNHSSGGTQNLYFNGNLSFSSNGPDKFIVMMWDVDALGVEGWYEVSRSDGKVIDPASARAGGLEVPSVAGTYTATLPLATGTLSVEPGATGTPPANTTYKATVKVAGTVTLAANQNVSLSSASAGDGDKVYISGEGSAVTLGGFTLTVAGITIRSNLALSGKWIVTAYYDIGAAAWVPSLFIDPSTAGWVDSSADIPANSIDLGAKGVANSITSTEYGALSVDTAALANNSVSFAKLDASVQAQLGNLTGFNGASLSIPTAQVLTLNGTPQTIIPAAGVGTVIEILSVMGSITFNAAAYATNLNIQLVNTGSTEPLFEDNSLLASTISKTVQFGKVAGASGAGNTQVLTNTGVDVYVQTGNPAVGDSDIKIYVLYRVVTL